MTRLATVLIGFGRMGCGYARDEAMACHYPYATHAQVLRDNPAYEWTAVVDPSEEARETARRDWNVRFTVADVSELPTDIHFDVAVLATPPEGRSAVLEGLPNLRAVIVEKPLGRSLEEASAFAEFCARRGIVAQVNIWRRADDLTRELAHGGLTQRIGEVLAAFGVYGNGVRNNGTHMVDLAAMLRGPIRAVQATPGITPMREGPIDGDVNLPFTLLHEHGPPTFFQPLSFSHYRENALDLWGESGRLALWQEGLLPTSYPLRPNRAMSGEREIASDEPVIIPSSVGRAYYRLYDDLADALEHGYEPVCPLRVALDAARVVDALLLSAQQGWRVVEVLESA